MLNMFLGGFFLNMVFDYFEEEEYVKGLIYIVLVILNIVLGLTLN